MIELRQAYLMSNLVEHFHQSVYCKSNILNLHSGLEAQEIAIKNMMKIMKDTIVDEAEFTRIIPYKYTPLDVIYKDKYHELFEEMKIENLGYHREFKTLLVDTFNTIHKDTNLKHNTLKLVVRFFSEKKEFIRNIERMLLVFDRSEWDFYMWTKQEIRKFERKIDKSSLWLQEEDEFYDYKYIKDVLGCLLNLDQALYHQHQVTYSKDNDKYEISILDQDMKIDIFVQKIYSNVKIYDNIISFIKKNKKLLNLVRKI